MAVTGAGERDGSRQKLILGTGQHQLNYWVQVDDYGTADNDVAAWALNPANIPATYGTLVNRTITSEEQTGSLLWYVTATYEYPQIREANPPPVGTARFRFRAAGEQQTITIPRSVISRHVPSGTPITYEGIGDDGKKLNGVSIIYPKYGFGYDFTIAGASLNGAYLNTIAPVVGSTNNATWKGFAQGEVRLDDINGQIELGRDSTISFEFSYSENEAAVTIPTITPFARRGWEYLDIHSSTAVDGGVVKSVVKQVDVLQVYPEADFDLLGIP